MAHLKLYLTLTLLVLTSSTSSALILRADSLSCEGLDIEPSELYLNKIERSLKLFSQNPAISKPKFVIRKTGPRCYNAWADIERKRVILTEPVAKDFFLDELAGIISHEFAHLEFPLEKEHWRTDLRGAELTSKKIMLSKLNRMKSICEELRRVETTNLETLDWQVADYVTRIYAVKKF